MMFCGIFVYKLQTESTSMTDNRITKQQKITKKKKKHETTTKTKGI